MLSQILSLQGALGGGVAVDNVSLIKL